MLSPSRSLVLRSRYMYIAAVVLVSILTWVSGAPFSYLTAYAVQLDTVSDILSTSRPGLAADHTIRFETPSGVSADGSTIVLTIPGGFDMSTIGEDDIDIADDGVDLTTAATCGGVQAAVSTSTQTITIVVCAGGGGTIGAGSIVSIEIGQHATSSGTGAARITNHGSIGSYTLSIGGTMADEGSTQLVIVEPVAVSGQVMTYLAFDVNGRGAGGTVNGDVTTLTGTTTATTVPFGIVVPGAEYLLAQNLQVSTNAQQGFVVTVQARDDLRASNNATIDTFMDGTSEATPTAWDVPSATPGSPDTYGHWGVTTEDATLSDGDSFSSGLYVGNFITSPREVMYATTSADGLTTHTGSTTVGYKLEVSVMQEAAADYQTTLVYVATPTF